MDKIGGVALMPPIELKITLQPKQRQALNQTETSPITFFGGS